MTSSEIVELIKALKESGVMYFKQGDLELEFDTYTQKKTAAVKIPFEPVSLEKPPEIPEKEVPHIVQEMRSLFKASDMELVDNLFPLPKPEEAN